LRFLRFRALWPSLPHAEQRTSARWRLSIADPLRRVPTRCTVPPSPMTHEDDGDGSVCGVT